MARGAVRTDAILRATLDLLAEAGYDQLTMDAVAARAKASKATIYRHWPGKADLVVAAVHRHSGVAQPAPDAAGNLRDDLLGVLTAMRAGLTGQDAALLLGLIQAMRRDPALADAVRGRVVDTKREAFGAVVERAAARGELPAGADPGLVAEISSAVLLSRLLLTGGDLDDPFLRTLVDDALLPMLRPRETR